MRILDSGRDFSSGRVPVIYIENHDHRRFMLKTGGRNEWPLTQPYIIALFTCAGAILLYNAQEYGQDNDMPESGSGRVVPRPIDWNTLQKEPGPTIFARYQQMIQIRKNYAGLRSSHFYPQAWDEGWTELNQQGFGIDRGRNVVVYHRWGDDGMGHLEPFYIVLNFSQQTQHVAFEVPDAGFWHNLIDDSDVSASDGRIHIDIGSN